MKIKQPIQPTLFRNCFHEPILSQNKPPYLQTDSAIRMAYSVKDINHKSSQQNAYNPNTLKAIYDSSFLSQIIVRRLSRECNIEPAQINTNNQISYAETIWFKDLLKKVQEENPHDNESNNIQDLYWDLAKSVEFNLHPHDALIFRLAAALEDNKEAIEWVKKHIPEWQRKSLRRAYKELHYNNV